MRDSIIVAIAAIVSFGCLGTVRTQEIKITKLYESGFKECLTEDTEHAYRTWTIEDMREIFILITECTRDIDEEHPSDTFILIDRRDLDFVMVTGKNQVMEYLIDEIMSSVTGTADADQLREELSDAVAVTTNEHSSAYVAKKLIEHLVINMRGGER